MRGARALGLLLLLGALLGPGAVAAAGAEDDAAFREAHDRALQAFRAERYEDAIVALQAAWALRPDPRLLLNLGHAYRRLGRREEALRNYERYREEAAAQGAAAPTAADEYIAMLRPAPAPPPPPELRPEPPPPELRPEPPRRRVVIVPAPLRVRPPEPIYRRWWFWGLLGVAAAGGALTAGLLATQPWDANLPAGVRIHDPKFAQGLLLQFP